MKNSLHKEILGEIEPFLESILEGVQRSGIHEAELGIMDHVCYRVETEREYAEMKDRLKDIASLSGEVDVNGRLISTHRLHDPIKYEKWRIDAVELPAPKKGHPYSTGLEHVEFVIFDTLIDFMNKHSDLEFETRAIDRGINPELGLKLPNSHYSVKFHRLPLLTVVEVVEPKMGITKVNDGM